MKVLIDANVMFPTVLREIVLGVAGEGLFTPLWSARILEEWARAAVKLGPGAEEVARGEIALLRAAWPRAEIVPRAGDGARLWLPDPADVHVLAAAIAGSADLILTLNAKDFPRGELAAEGIGRRDPDGLLMELWLVDGSAVERAVMRVHGEAERLSGEAVPLRALLKRARLPRLGKALARG
ncbi:PIN domain-containing protein [Tranquillimonas rosea]|uniref:PIN domain-containing protein n=1 Tax=Tranquillimonas rosea TaxID=641238 RepID=A0A1H9TMN3_9RHOB|nr:PIN domain-containing protein [Tranquillimonas rosea]SER98416.1 PIN domain-containing protein [Tranquillimonas rosea]